MAEFDLTSKLGQYLDRHLVFPLLEFLSVKEIYDDNEMQKGKLDLLSNTNMVDFAMDVHKGLYPDQEVPEALHKKRAAVVSQLKNLTAETEDITAIFEEAEVISKIQTTRDGKQLFEYLNKEFKIQPSDKNFLNALWGKLASEILMQSWDTALDDLNRIKEIIDANVHVSQLQLLQQRTWLIHWSLFVFFNHPKGRDLIIDMFLYQQQYLNSIQTMCPHIFRYLTTAVITNKSRRRTVLKELVKIIQLESYQYKDPITEFIECLYVNFDFDGAQKKLRECESVLVNDFFLVACLDDFIDNARLLIFETFCRIHQCISIDMLAEKLNMPPDEAERWIVNLIRNARLDAKIDSQLGHVVMGTQAVSPYQQVIEKTKGLSFKSQMLALNIEKRLGIRSNENVPQWGAQD